MKHTRALLAFALAGGCLCVQPFAPSYILDKPRILALRSTPVDLVLDAGVTLDALVYLPSGSPTPAYSWSWCAALGGVTNGFTCSITAQELQDAIDPDGGLGLSLSYSLGTTASVQMPFPISTSAFTSACADILDGGLAADADAGGMDAGGTDAGVMTAGLLASLCRNGSTITVLLTMTVGKETYQAYRNLNLLPKPSAYLGENPTIDALTQSASGVALPDGGIPSHSQALLADIAPDASGEFAGIFTGDAGDVDGGLQYVDGGDEVALADGGFPQSDGGGAPREVLLSEGLTLSWYVQRGVLTSATTDLPIAPVGASRDWSGLLGNWWEPGDGGPAEMILVLRGSQGGVGWLTTTVAATAGTP